MKQMAGPKSVVLNGDRWGHHIVVFQYCGTIVVFFSIGGSVKSIGVTL